MKSYANFILLENLLYTIPDSVPAIKSLSESLFNPRVNVVEEDCQPGIGTTMAINSVLTSAWTTPIDTTRYMYEYLLDLDGAFLDATALSAILASGQATEIMVRHTGSCNSTGGVCRVCCYSNMIASTSDVVDTLTDTVSTNYYDAPPAMDVDVRVPAVGENFVLMSSMGQVKPFFQPSQRAYFAWLSGTYSGALAGISAYDTYPLPVKHSLASQLINPHLLESAAGELSRIKAVPSNFIDYMDKLDDKVEKAMAIVLLYCVYGGRPLAPITGVFPRSRNLRKP